MIRLAVALPFLYAKYVVLSYSFYNLHGHDDIGNKSLLYHADSHFDRLCSQPTVNLPNGICL